MCVCGGGGAIWACMGGELVAADQGQPDFCEEPPTSCSVVASSHTHTYNMWDSSRGG